MQFISGFLTTFVFQIFVLFLYGRQKTDLLLRRTAAAIGDIYCVLFRLNGCMGDVAACVGIAGWAFAAMFDHALLGTEFISF